MPVRIIHSQKYNKFHYKGGFHGTCLYAFDADFSTGQLWENHSGRFGAEIVQ